MNFEPFRSPKFNHVNWINELLENDCNTDDNLTESVTQLQTQMESIMQALDRSCQDAAVTVPRLLRDVELLKSHSLTLNDELMRLHEDLKKINENENQDLIDELAKLHLVKQNVQSAAAALGETDRWSNLIGNMEDLFDSNDSDQICSHIESLEQCLISFTHLTDYDDRIKKLNSFKDKFESLLIPQFLEQMHNSNLFLPDEDDNHDDNNHNYNKYNNIDDDYNASLKRNAVQYIDYLTRIGRLEAIKKHYSIWCKNQIHILWTFDMKSISINDIPQLHHLELQLKRYSDLFHVLLTDDNSSSGGSCMMMTTGTKTTLNTGENADRIESIEKIAQFFAILIYFVQKQLKLKLFAADQCSQQILFQCLNEVFDLRSVKTSTLTLNLLDQIQSMLGSGGGAGQDQEKFWIQNTFLLNALFKILLLVCVELEICFRGYAQINENVSADRSSSSAGCTFHQLLFTLVGPVYCMVQKCALKTFESRLDHKRLPFPTDQSLDWSDIGSSFEKLSVSLHRIVHSYKELICFSLNETGHLLLPYCLNSIYVHWDSLIHKWLALIEQISNRLTSVNSVDQSDQVDYHFGWALKFANLTGELCLNASQLADQICAQSDHWYKRLFESITVQDCGQSNLAQSIMKSLRQIMLSQCDEDNCKKFLKQYIMPFNLQPDLNLMMVAKDKLPSSNLVNLKPLLGSDLTSHIKFSNSMVCKRAVDMLKQVALAPLRQILKKISDLSVWYTVPEIGEANLPDFAYLPQDYMTYIGQYLLTLPTQLEPYLLVVSSDQDDDDHGRSGGGGGLIDPSSAGLKHCVLLGTNLYPNLSATASAASNLTTSKVNQADEMKQPSSTSVTSVNVLFHLVESLIVNDVCELLVNRFLRLGRVNPKNRLHDAKGDRSDMNQDQALLTAHGFKQLNVDLDYFLNMLGDLDVNVPINLSSLKELISCDRNQFETVSLNKPPTIVNAVAVLRGF